MKKIHGSPLLSALLVFCLSATALTQTQSPSPGSVVTVVFSFKTTPAGVVGYQGENEENRFYIEVPAGNKPTASIPDIESSVEIRREAGKSNEAITTYSVAFRRGTSPRFGRGQSGNEMVLTFSPPDGSSNVAHNAVNQGSPNSSGAGASSTGPPLDAASPSPKPAAIVGQPAQAKPPTSSASPASDQPSPNAIKTAGAQKVNTANLDLSVPDSPAFTVLGLTPQTVVRPTSPRQFASSLLNGIDQRGNLQTGVALDAAPYLVFAGSALTLKNYRDSYFLRFLARTQTSFATTKGASDNDKSIRMALGFHFTLLDLGDPHSDIKLMECFAKGLSLDPPPISIDPNDPAPDETLKKKRAAAYATLAKQNEAAAEDCRAKRRKENWNRTSWIVAGAPAWMSPTGQTKDLHYDGAGAWTSFAYGFEHVPGLEKTSQLIVHARYRDNEMVPEPDMNGKFFKQDSFFLGGSLRAGTPNSAVSFEGVFQRLRREGLKFDNSSRIAFGIDRKIAENIWFNLAFGAQTATPGGERKGFVVTSFKWGFSGDKTIQTPVPTQ